ncbi:MAG: MEDS domain-containing protein [Clostridia bacterium]
MVDSREEEYRLLLPFLHEGLRGNSRLATMVGEANLTELLTYLRREGLDPEALMASGRLDISTAEQVFPRDASATPERILAQTERQLDATHAAGFRALRGFREMHCALASLRRADELLEYETRVNFLALKMIEPLVCVYDVNRVPPALLAEILCAHPKAIVGGVLQENPWFVSPRAGLRRVAERARRRLIVRERRAWALKV